MDCEDSNYRVHHQRLLFECDNTKEDFNKQCLVQTYSASLKLLNNEDALSLLRTNLSKCTKAMNDNEECEELHKNSNKQWKSSLGFFNIDDFLKPLSCATNRSSCCGKADIEQENVDEVMKYFQSPIIKQTSNTEPKMRKIAKSFAPRSCNPTKKFYCAQTPSTVDININSSSADAIEETKLLSIANTFKTANEELQLQLKKYGNRTAPQTADLYNPQVAGQRKQLGTRRTVRNKFVSPLLSNNSSEDLLSMCSWPADEIIDERLKNIEPRMIELIRSEIMDSGASVDWTDIAGLDFAKTAIQEAVVWPLLRPDIFTGLRKPPKGILLFGPPGTGKTLIGKCVASQSKSTFFSISASSLTSKWVGDGEKMVRALFEVARCHQPAVIFIDEIDSLLSQRSDTEHESSRRIKTEFLVRLDGATTDSDEQILVIGATNRPQELDEAARRRFVKRLYIPLPEFKARLQIIEKLIQQVQHELTKENMEEISKLCDGYSGADMRNVCSEASLGPIRSMDMTKIESIQSTEVRSVNMDDFINALTRVKSSVSLCDLDQYLIWNKTYGSGF